MKPKKPSQNIYNRVSVTLYKDGSFHLHLGDNDGTGASSFSTVHFKTSAKAELLHFFNQLGKPASANPNPES